MSSASSQFSGCYLFLHRAGSSCCITHPTLPRLACAAAIGSVHRLHSLVPPEMPTIIVCQCLQKLVVIIADFMFSARLFCVPAAGTLASKPLPRP